jgi:hypothetical protein
MVLDTSTTTYERSTGENAVVVGGDEGIEGGIEGGNEGGDEGGVDMGELLPGVFTGLLLPELGII